MDELLHLPQSVEKITTWVQVGGLAVVLGFVFCMSWIRQSWSQSKALIEANAKNAELEVDNRKLKRDQEIASLKAEVASLRKYTEAIGKHFDECKAAHDITARETFGRIGTMEKTMVTKDDWSQSQRDIHKLNDIVVEIRTIITGGLSRDSQRYLDMDSGRSI